LPLDKNHVYTGEDSLVTDSDMSKSYDSQDFEREKDEELKRKMTQVFTLTEEAEFGRVRKHDTVLTEQ
jgi:hypothetical protein